VSAFSEDRNLHYAKSYRNISLTEAAVETTLTGKRVTDTLKPGSRVQMCGRSDRDGATERDAGCGPEIDAKLRVRVKDASVLGSMLVL
jgi:hypothetical protein